LLVVPCTRVPAISSTHRSSAALTSSMLSPSRPRRALLSHGSPEAPCPAACLRCKDLDVNVTFPWRSVSGLELDRSRHQQSCRIRCAPVGAGLKAKSVLDYLSPTRLRNRASDPLRPGYPVCETSRLSGRTRWRDGAHRYPHVCHSDACNHLTSAPCTRYALLTEGKWLARIR
jgi:hypothetical protein